MICSITKIELLSNVVVLFMETASLERSITRLPPVTGFDEPLAALPDPELVPEVLPAPEAQPARISGTAARAAAAERRTLLFIRFLGCRESYGTRPAERDERCSVAARFRHPSFSVPNVTIVHVF